jgi:UDP-glucuronate 4-epimerase
LEYLVTGAAGFIGYFIAKRLCEQGHQVIGIDNLNNYYDPKLKLAHLEQIEHFDNFLL